MKAVNYVLGLLFVSTLTLGAQSGPVVYRCLLNGVSAAVPGYLVVSSQDPAGSLLDLSDGPAMGDTADEFSSASLMSYNGRVTASLERHDPNLNANDMTAFRFGEKSADVVVGSPIHLEYVHPVTNTTVSLDCKVTTLTK